MKVVVVVVKVAVVMGESNFLIVSERSTIFAREITSNNRFYGHYSRKNTRGGLQFPTLHHIKHLSIEINENGNETQHPSDNLDPDC